jgi:hypothetical protein
MTRRRILTRALLTASLVIAGVTFEGSVATASAKKTAVTFCAVKSLTEKTGRTGAAAGTAYTDLVFTNRGATTCSLSGIPKAQPVFGLKHTPVGPSASINRITGRGGLVKLAAHKGVANVLYAMSTAENYPKAKCIPKYATGVVITLRSSTRLLLTTYFAMSKKLVCTKLQSTTIAGVTAGATGNP